jgi:hypothetical protein
MTVLSLPLRDAAALVRDQQQGLEAWRRETTRRLAVNPETEADREAQMDARRHLAGLQRTRSAVMSMQATRRRGPAAAAYAPRAVVVHRYDLMRERIKAELVELGVQIVGEGEDGAVAVAMVLVEQPELLVIEDRLPWVTPLEVVAEVHRFAPHTVVAVQLEDRSLAASLLEAGATAVVGRTTRPAEFCECCVEALSTSA